MGGEAAIRRNIKIKIIIYQPNQYINRINKLKHLKTMKHSIKISVMALVAMFAFNTVADAQKWAYQASFSEGRACVKDDSGKWGYIDESGKVISPCKWRSNKYYKEGLGPVMDENEKYGYLDLDGNQVIPCQFVYGAHFSEGLAAVAVEGYKYGYIDKTGKIVIPCQWENAYSFERGVAKVQVKQEDGQRVWKKIDKTGKYIE
jgi:hypothetical protein